MVSESDFAMTGTTLTTSESFFNTTISIGFKLDRKKERYVRSKQQKSKGIFLLFTHEQLDQ
jgi:hypothetical protein